MALAPAWARVALRALRPWRDWSWRSAQGCVVPGDDLARVVAARGVAAAKIHRLPNWAPAGVTACDGRPLRREWGIDGRFVIAYSGNLGRVHALAPLLDVAEHLRARPDIVFLFIGNGPQRRALEATARERKLDLVHFLPPQPRARLAESLSAANVHLVTLRRGCEGTVWPSKFYGALTVHRPVLYVGPEGTELDRTIRTHRLGGSFRPESPEAIAGWIRQLADDSQRQKQLQTDVTRYAATLPGATAAADFWAAAHAAPVARAAV